MATSTSEISSSTPRQRALITGASSGIGYELTLLFAKDKYNLVLVARSEAKLRELAQQMQQQYGVEATVIPKDLTNPNAPAEIFRELKQQGLPVHILVNNAGFGDYGYFKELDMQKQLDMIQVNITALTHLTKLFLDQISEKVPGKILNVASVAAFQPGPLMAVYYATKAFVLSFSEALANELQGSNISLTVLCPGATATDFERKAQLENSKLFQGTLDTAKEVAESGYKALMEQRVIEVPGLKNKLSTFAVRLFPRNVIRKIVRQIQERR